MMEGSPLRQGGERGFGARTGGDSDQSVLQHPSAFGVVCGARSAVAQAAQRGDDPILTIGITGTQGLTLILGLIG